MTEINLPANVLKIGKEAFFGAKKLKTISIRTSKLKEASIGANAFKGIYGKAKILVPENKVALYKKILKKRGLGAGSSVLGVY